MVTDGIENMLEAVAVQRVTPGGPRLMRRSNYVGLCISDLAAELLRGASKV